VNSEEIEVSLRAEFEGYLKEVSEGFKKKLSALQASIDQEIARHKEEFAKVFSDAADHFDAQASVKPAFADIVAEHLKLARDEGSQISALAFAEAEKFEKENAQPVEPAAPAEMGSVANLRDAIKDVTEKHSQVDILKALIQHAEDFAPRGAFFVLKNERFGGWKTFGHGTDSEDDAIKQVSFSITDPSVVNEAVKDNAVKESSFGEYAEDKAFLSQVGFGEPEHMYAVPLVVRGRSVAVLYADSGSDGAKVNVDALDTLVGVASLRVELLASLKNQPETPETSVETPAPAYTPAEQVQEKEVPGYTAAPSYEEIHEEESANSYQETVPAIEEFSTPVSQPTTAFYDEPAGYSFESETAVEEPVAKVEEKISAAPAEWESRAGIFEANQPIASPPVVSPEVAEVVEDAPAAEFEYTSNFEAEPVQEFEVEPSYEASPAPSFEGFAPVTEAPSFAKDSSFEAFKKPEPEVSDPLPADSGFTTEVVSQPVSTPVRSRLSERNVELPIEVSDEERRLHNDARRFARLLVSEIKLYNDQKVKEGRDNGDLYNRLQEAVDRSREMYDKRVQPAVAGRFDYFHYELVNSLAEGDESKLGSGYPGAAV
jgi:hypothetical protein